MKQAKFEFESPDTNPEECVANRACVLVTLPGGKQFDVQIDATEDGIYVELIDYIGLNTLASTQAWSDDIGKLGNDDFEVERKL